MTRRQVPVRKSRTQTAQIVLPNHTNALGTAFGGVIVGWMDIAAAIAAKRFCGHTVVTASIDALHFLAPVKLGQIINIVAQVNYAGRSSMEVGVRIDTEDPATGDSRYTAKAYLTFVAIGNDGLPVEVPEALTTSEDERRRYDEAVIRRKSRLELADTLKRSSADK